MSTFDCECCELKYANPLRPVAFTDYTPPVRCQICIEHQGKPLQRAQDHAQEYRRRMDIAIGAARKADKKTAAAEAESERAFRSRDRAVQALDRVAVYHRHDRTRDRCLCGKPSCPTLRVLSDPWVTERLANLSDAGQFERRIAPMMDRQPRWPR